MVLYEATVTIYISAENTDRARSIAAFETPRFMDLWEIQEADGVNADWWHIIPYGHGEDDKTCGDYMLAIRTSAKAPIMVPTTAEEEGA